MPKPVIVSGIQPSGRLHVGNYLGALKNFVDLQNSENYRPFFFIADYHSLTETYEPKKKAEQILDLAASYLVAGLNPKKSTLFIQSHVSAHNELAWILSCLTPVGELERMTQFKDKSQNQSQAGNINAGLFTYPVLMAADILLYDARLVPVGDDQSQHLELTRILARKFNNRYGPTLTEPVALHTKTPRVMSLTDPTKKMSKSSPKGCLFLDDEPKAIKKKIMSATTDSEAKIYCDLKNKPGISNLLLILASLTEKPIKALEKEFEGQNYGQFKATLADELIKHFAPFRKEKAALAKTPNKILKAFAQGEKIATKLATAKIKEIKSKAGLI